MGCLGNSDWDEMVRGLQCHVNGSWPLPESDSETFNSEALKQRRDTSRSLQ